MPVSTRPSTPPWIPDTLVTGEGKVSGHSGNKAPTFQPYDTFQCKDGYVYIGALGPIIYARVPKFLKLNAEEFSYDNCSKDAAAVSSPRGWNSTAS